MHAMHAMHNHHKMTVCPCPWQYVHVPHKAELGTVGYTRFEAFDVAAAADQAHSLLHKYEALWQPAQISLGRGDPHRRYLSFPYHTDIGDIDEEEVGELRKLWVRIVLL